jgi:hypothetical protein
MSSASIGTGLAAIAGSAVGTNCFYQVVPGSCVLSVLKVESQRVCMDSPNTMPVTFIECHNLQAVKDKGAGKVIAIHEGEDKAHLGFVVSIDVSGRKLTLFYQRWCGSTTHAGVPLVCLIPENETWDDSYQHHFVSETFTYSLNDNRGGWPRVKFLNQICGPRPGGGCVALASGLVNPKDGGIQCSSLGPDFFLPFKHLPSDSKPLACSSSAHKCFMPRVDTTSKVTPFPPKPFKVSSSRKKRKMMQDCDAPFAKEGYQSFDIHAQTAVFVENLASNKDGIFDALSNECTTKLGLFYVPYLERACPVVGDVCFGLLSKVSLQELFSFSDQLLPAQHDVKVSELQTTEIILHSIDLQDHPAGVRFCTVDPRDFTDLRSQPSMDFIEPSSSRVCQGSLISTGFIGRNEELPAEAVMVSRWCGWPNEEHEIGNETAEFFVSAYKNGFGSRKCTQVIGLNVYQGKHQGEIATPDLTRGPGEGVNHQYYRKVYTDILLPQCETIVSKLAREAMTMGRSLDPIVYRLLAMSQDEDPVLGVCRRKILTMGLLAKCLGFANSPHTDHFDFYPASDQQKFIESFRSYLEAPQLRNRVCASYLKRWVDQYNGFCRPTTCGYVFSGSLKGDASRVQIFQYFLLEGLGFAVRFMSEIIHHFYGDLFSHNTAVCVAIGSDGMVSYKSNPSNFESFRVFAWGGS